MIKIKTITHTNVRGDTLYYINIIKGEYSLLINVGLKNYLAAKELDKVQELPLNEKEV